MPQTFFNANSNISDQHLLIQKMTISEILSRAEIDNDFELQCKAEVLNDFWRAKFEGLFSSHESVHPTVLEEVDAFDQFRGQYYYHTAINAKELDAVSTVKKPNLSKAIKYHSFDAIFFVMKNTPDISLKVALTYLAYLNPPNTTPAFLLYAQTYLNFALSSSSSDDAEMISLYLDQAYIYLYLAEKVYKKSDKAIYNATYGLGLEKIFPDFKSFTEAREFVGTLIEQYGQIKLSSYLISLMDKANSLLLEVSIEEPLITRSSP